MTRATPPAPTQGGAFDDGGDDRGEDDEGGGGGLYCTSRALDDAAEALTRLFRAFQEEEANGEGWNPAAPHVAVDRAAPRPPPFVRHAAAANHIAAHGVGWDAAVERLLAQVNPKP